MQTSDLLPLNDEFEHIAVYAVLAFFPSIHERRRLIVVVLAPSLSASRRNTRSSIPGGGILKSAIWLRM